MKKEWIYINEPSNKVRYVLGYKGKKTLVCLGINPSTAEPEKLDNSLKSVERIAIHNGYDSFVMLNVYPVRATIFKTLPKEVKKEFFEKNINEIDKMLSTMKNPIDIWIAFGNHVNDRVYLRESWQEISMVLNKYKVKYYVAGINKTGMPKHPLYLKKDTMLQSVNKIDI